MYDLFFSSQQLKAKHFRKRSCNVVFSYIQLKLTDKMVDDLRRQHQQAIEGRGQAFALLNKQASRYRL